MIRATARIFLWGLLICLITIAVAFGIIFYHPQGVYLLVRGLNTVSNAHLEIGDIKGQLGTSFILNDLQFDSPSTSIQVDEVNFSWKPLNLLKGRLTITEFIAKNAILENHPDESSFTFEQKVEWHLPISLEIDSIKAENLQYISGKSTFNIRNFSIDGHFDNNVWYVDTYHLDSAFGQASGSAVIDPTSLGLSFSVEHFSPFVNMPDWTADVSFAGDLLLSKNDQHLELNQIAGAWMDKDIQGHWKSRIENDTSTWEGYIDVNENHFSTEGRLGMIPEVSWLIYAPNLGRLLPNAKGHFFSEGVLMPDTFVANFDVEHFQWGRFVISDLEGSLEGNEPDHHFEASGLINDQTLSFTYEGSSLFEKVKGTITTANIDDLILQQPLELTFSTDVQRISHGCFSNESTRLCLDYENEQTPSTWSINLHANQVSLETANHFIPEAFTVSGIADINIALEKSISGQISGHTSVKVQEGEWEWIDQAGRQYDFPIESLRLSISGTDDLIGHLVLNMSDKNTLDAQLVADIQSVDDWRQAPIEGIVTLIATDLDAIEFIAPSIEVLSGQVVASIHLGGTLTDPALFESHAVLNEVNIPLLDINTAVYIDELTLDGLPEDVVHIDGHGQMGQGTFKVNGVIDLAQQYPNVSLKIDGERLLLLDTQEYRIIASPNLRYNSGKVSGSVLHGKIQLDDATIALNDQDAARRLSEDVIIVNADQQNADNLSAQQNNMSTHIAISIPKPVSFSGFGLSSQFVGDFRIDSAPGQDYTKADGRLSLTQGEYKAFGKTFTIQTGDILYNGGPLRNPVVDIRADRCVTVKTPAPASPAATANTDDASEGTTASAAPSGAKNETVLVGLALKGPLRQPHITFYSEPPMNDGDIVSYLFIGRPQDQASAAQAEVLFQAVSELMPFTGSAPLGQRFGLDEFGLTQLSGLDEPSSLLDNTALVIGKQLSSRLYVRYIRGLSTTIDTVTSDFQVRLFLGKHFTLEGNADSNGYGGDLIFSIDRP